MTISRAQLAKELEPGLNALFGLEYDRYENEAAEIFESEGSDRAFEEEVMLSGFGTAPVKKLLGHLAVAFILVIIAEIKITNMYGIFGVNEIPDWASILLSVFTYTVIVNAFNLVDGVDGLAAGIGSISCLALGTWFYFAGAEDNAVLAISLAGALIAFLIFNFEPARVFMGDSGSLTIGLIISV